MFYQQAAESDRLNPVPAWKAATGCPEPVTFPIFFFPIELAWDRHNMFKDQFILIKKALADNIYGWPGL